MNQNELSKKTMPIVIKKVKPGHGYKIDLLIESWALEKKI